MSREHEKGNAKPPIQNLPPRAADIRGDTSPDIREKKGIDIRDSGHIGNSRNKGEYSTTPPSKNTPMSLMSKDALASLMSTPLDRKEEECVRDSLPYKHGMYAASLLKLACRLQSLKKPRMSFRAAVAHWMKGAKAFIDDLPFETVWETFCETWEKVKKPYGEKMNVLMQQVRHDPPSEVASEFESVKARELVGLCELLQRHAGDDPFFLSCRAAGEALGIHHEPANALLKTLCACGVLRLVENGTRRGTSKPKASTFYYLPLFPKQAQEFPADNGQEE